MLVRGLRVACFALLPLAALFLFFAFFAAIAHGFILLLAAGFDVGPALFLAADEFDNAGGDRGDAGGEVFEF
jgi:hypothetical protein